jgi:ABC-type uncharacterized transport system ATPase subunit
LPELLGVCHRIAVMRAGTIVAILDASDATEERIMHLAAGLDINHRCTEAQRTATEQAPAERTPK